jgi:dephospho-CoA kinase
LVESGDRWRRQVDWVCVVDCQTETQIQRVMARSALTRPEIEDIMAQQANRAKRLASADAVIYNDGIDFVQLKHLAHETMARFEL